MLVSVIMPVYNGEKYLEEAIESVLVQTYAPIELVIIDDGSQDKTAQIVKKYGSKVRYFYQSNQGQPSATNFGLFVAQGNYITFLDADDIYMQDKTLLQVAFLEETPHMDFVFGYVEQFLSPELPSEVKKKRECPPGITPGYLAGAGLFRKKCFECIGTFNVEQRIGLFIEWYMRAMEGGLKHGLIPQLVLRRRIHENNMGVHAQGSRLEYLNIVKASLRRRVLQGCTL